MSAIVEGKREARSRKIYSIGSDPSIRVPMREIELTNGERARRVRHERTVHRSGRRDRRARRHRADARSAGSRPQRHGRTREAVVDLPHRPRSDAASSTLSAFKPQRLARRSEARCERHADALRAAGHHHAGDGVHRDPRELRAGVRARRSRARPRDHPAEHQPSRESSR